MTYNYKLVGVQMIKYRIQLAKIHSYFLISIKKNIQIMKSPFVWQLPSIDVYLINEDGDNSSVQQMVAISNLLIPAQVNFYFMQRRKLEELNVTP